MSLVGIKLKHGDKVKCIESTHLYKVGEIHTVFVVNEERLMGSGYYILNGMARLQSLTHSVTGNGERFTLVNKYDYITRTPKNKPKVCHE